MTYLFVPEPDLWAAAGALRPKLLAYQIDWICSDLENFRYDRRRDREMEAQWGVCVGAETVFGLYMASFIGTKSCGVEPPYRWQELQNFRTRWAGEVKGFLEGHGRGQGAKPPWLGMAGIHDSHKRYLAFKNGEYAVAFGIKRPTSEPEILWT